MHHYNIIKFKFMKIKYRSQFGRGVRQNKIMKEKSISLLKSLLILVE